jgi:hypothetical protein
MAEARMVVGLKISLDFSTEAGAHFNISIDPGLSCLRCFAIHAWFTFRCDNLPQ